MAVVYPVTEIGDGRSGDIDEKGIRKYQRSFRVRTSSTTDDALVVRTALTVPRIGDIYLTNASQDSGARCKAVAARQDGDNPYLWIVTCDYDSAPWDTQDRDKQEPNPLLRPAKIGFKASGKRYAQETDVYGNDLVNSAGDPFDPPIEVDRYHLVMTVEKNFQFFDPLVIVTHVGHVNDALWLGWSSGKVLLVDLSADQQEESGFTFWAVKYTFEFATHPETWVTKVLDAGYNAIYTLPVVGDVKLSVTDAKGQKESKPVLLDGNGGVLSQAALEASGAVYIDFWFYPRADFGGLGL